MGGMSNLKKVVLGLAFLGIVSLAGLVAIGQLVYPAMRRCKALEPGATEADLILAVGDPVRTESRGGQTWTVYPHPSPVAAGPVRARIDSTTREVLSLQCSEDGPADW